MLLKHHASFTRAITRLAGAIYKEIRQFSRSIYVCLRALESRGKFRENHWDRSWDRKLFLLTDQRRIRTVAYITPKNIRWGHWVHATFRRVNNWIALYERATYEFLCANAPGDGRRENFAISSRWRRYIASYRRDIFATGICIREYRRFPGHVGVRLKDGIRNEDDSSYTFYRSPFWRSCNFTAIEICFRCTLWLRKCYEFL